MTRGGQRRAARAHRRRPARDPRRGAEAATSPTVPQVWALYKEVQDYYEKGMRVPDDVTLLWCDDNWGNIRRLPTAEERKRPGGAGIYYHFDYVGGPAHLQVAQHRSRSRRSGSRCTSPTRYGADRHLDRQRRRPQADGVPDRVLPRLRLGPRSAGRPSGSTDYLRAWAEREFGATHAARDRRDRRDATRGSTAAASPRCSSRGTYSLVELPRGRDGRGRLPTRSRAGPRRSTRRCPTESRDAFFQLVLYPVKACADAQRAVRDGRAGTASTPCRDGRRPTTSRSGRASCSGRTRRSRASTTRRSPAASGTT